MTRPELAGKAQEADEREGAAPVEVTPDAPSAPGSPSGSADSPEVGPAVDVVDGTGLAEAAAVAAADTFLDTFSDTDPELGFTPADSPDPWLGRRLGERYEIDALIGEGTSGVVYRARHLAMDKPVAVKLLHGMALGSRRSEMEERFRLEARVYGQITHPHVCAATDYGVTDDGVRYLTMELLKGRTLADAIDAEAPMAPERAVAIAMQVADGLSAVHDCGVVHRDLKPENVFLVSFQGEDDWVKLVDFGIARNTEDERDAGRLTGAGMIYGTPAYLAPEQTRTMDVDARADLYALGVVLFEMLAGRLPFERQTPLGYMQAHAAEVPPQVHEVAEGVPPSLSLLVDRLLDKEPERRPPDADTVRGLLALSLDSVVAIDEEQAAAARRAELQRAQLLGSGLRPTAEPSESGKQGISVAMFALAVVIVAVAALSIGRSMSSDDEGTAAAAVVDSATPGEVARQKKEGPPTSSNKPAVAEGRDFFSPLSQGTAQVETASEQLVRERNEFVARVSVRSALAERSSNPQLALNVMTRLMAAEPKNAHVRYFAGLIQHDTGNSIDAAQSWMATTKLDGRYSADPEIAARLLDDFALPNETARKAAAKAIGGTGMLLHAAPALSSLIRTGMNADQVARLHALATRLKVLSEMAEPDRSLLMIRAVSDCASRSKALVALSEAGDPSALPVLQRLQESHRGCGPSGNDDCITCIRPLLERVIGQLKD